MTVSQLLFNFVITQRRCRTSKYCRHLWDPKHVHCYFIYLSYYGSVWPEDEFCKSKLVASLHIDNKLMCFRLILILKN
jgi:hypothetical protein